MASTPPTPTKRFLLKLAIPITSWGTTWPMDRIRDLLGCAFCWGLLVLRLDHTWVLSWAGQGWFTIPSVALLTISAGACPIVTTSFLQSCTINGLGVRFANSSPNILRICVLVMGACVPNAGRIDIVGVDDGVVVVVGLLVLLLVSLSYLRLPPFCWVVVAVAVPVLVVVAVSMDGGDDVWC